MSENHLRQPGFTFYARGRFIKHKKRIQKIKETRNTSTKPKR